jgi:hypothetical protein
MSLFDALKMLVLGALLIFLAAECSSKTHSRVERPKDAQQDTLANSP